jgi:hypothetical protein
LQKVLGKESGILAISALAHALGAISQEVITHQLLFYHLKAAHEVYDVKSSVPNQFTAQFSPSGDQHNI